MKNSPDAITQQIRVLLADDHSVVRQGLATILKSQKDIKIVAEAANGDEACKLYDQLSPDVLLRGLAESCRNRLIRIGTLNRW